ncbi:MAG: DUF763 domain-containing protein, partial [Candidatus Helarchaeota archaeon]
GKGKTSLRTPDELVRIGDEFNFSERKIKLLQRSSRLAAKVDNAVLQDGYQLYHHCMVVAENGKWAVIQQGMNTLDRTARRYHWLSEHVVKFVEEPHEGIITDKRHKLVLDLTAKESRVTRKISVDLAKERPSRLASAIKSIRDKHQKSLMNWIKGLRGTERQVELEILEMPRNLNWAALEKAYEMQPANYEELISIRGIGPAALRALALISELIYGSKISWKDPAKFSFAHGGKDGVPFPVNRKTYESSIAMLENAIHEAKLGRRDKLQALKRLHYAYGKFANI